MYLLMSLHALHSTTSSKWVSALYFHVQERVARQYTAPKPRRAAMTERFLEEDLDEEPISDADEDGMRDQLARQRYVDQDEEVQNI